MAHLWLAHGDWLDTGSVARPNLTVFDILKTPVSSPQNYSLSISGKGPVKIEALINQSHLVDSDVLYNYSHEIAHRKYPVIIH